MALQISCLCLCLGSPCLCLLNSPSLLLHLLPQLLRLHNSRLQCCSTLLSFLLCRRQLGAQRVPLLLCSPHLCLQRRRRNL